MNKNDLMFFGFVAVWIILTAGTPDLIDAVVHRVMNTNCQYVEHMHEKE